MFFCVGILLFKHRVIKSFELSIKYCLDDPKMIQEDYLQFKSVKILDRGVTMLTRPGRGL